MQRIDGTDFALVGAECEQPLLLRVPRHGSDLRFVSIIEVAIRTENYTVRPNRKTSIKRVQGDIDTCTLTFIIWEQFKIMWKIG